MKLFYYAEYPAYWKDIYKATKDLKLEAWQICEPSNNYQGVPFIDATSDEKRMYPRWTVGEGMLIYKYKQFLSELLEHIDINEDVLILLALEDLETIYGNILYHTQDMINIILQKTKNVHVLAGIKDNFESADYHELIRFLYCENFFAVKSYAFYNVNGLVVDNEDVGEASEIICEAARTSIQQIEGLGQVEKNSIWLYNHNSQKYEEYHLTKEDMPDDKRLAFDILENIAPSNDRDTCDLLKDYRVRFAKRYGLRYKPVPCTYEGTCQGICRKCETDGLDLFYNAHKGDYKGTWNRNCNKEIKAHIRGISRFRCFTDGPGIRTLVLFNTCALKCKYCINKEIINSYITYREMKVDELLEYTDKDNLYYEVGGGITFGGGEPLLYAPFVAEFKRLRPYIHIAVQTSLNVNKSAVQRLLGLVDQWIIDIKDMNPDIYKRYVGFDNELVISNLRYLLECEDADNIIVRVPEIEGYNTQEEVELSVVLLEEMGVKHIERFRYMVV